MFFFRTKIEVLNDTHSAVHTTVQKKDIGFASPVAEDFRYRLTCFYIESVFN